MTKYKITNLSKRGLGTGDEYLNPNEFKIFEKLPISLNSGVLIETIMENKKIKNNKGVDKKWLQ